jgi:uncharacterized RDD family membrane protein YckC
VGANLLDGLVNFAVALPLIVPGFVMMFAGMDPANVDPMTGDYAGSAPNPIGFILLGLGYLLIFVFAIWNFVVRQGKTGQTLAKKWLGIKVIREANGEVPGIGLALGRYLLQGILTAVTLYLNLLWPLWDAKNQTLHDKVCNTVVIRVA